MAAPDSTLPDALHNQPAPPQLSFRVCGFSRVGFFQGNPRPIHGQKVITFDWNETIMPKKGSIPFNCAKEIIAYFLVLGYFVSIVTFQTDDRRNIDIARALHAMITEALQVLQFPTANYFANLRLEVVVCKHNVKAAAKVNAIQMLGGRHVLHLDDCREICDAVSAAGLFAVWYGQPLAFQNTKSGQKPTTPIASVVDWVEFDRLFGALGSAEELAKVILKRKNEKKDEHEERCAEVVACVW